MISGDYLRSLLVNSAIRTDRKLKCKASSKQCGNACVPKTKKCKQQQNPGLTNPINAKVEYLENQIKDLPYERGLVIHPQTGKVLVNKGGQQTSVEFTASEAAMMRGAIVTHNHPNLGWGKDDARSKGLSFSDADVQAACLVQAGEMRAVSAGYQHSLKPPDTGWDAQFWGRRVEPSYRRNERSVYHEFVGKVLTGKMRIDEAEANYHHEVISRTAKETGMKYERKNI